MATQTIEHIKTGLTAYTTDGLVGIYLAGPMRGIPDNNIPQFNDAADQLRELGYVVFNPGEQPEDWDGHGDELAWYLQRDLPALLRQHCVVVLPGWTESQGASIEVDVATSMHMPVFDYATGDRIDAMHYRPTNPYPVENSPAGPVVKNTWTPGDTPIVSNRLAGVASILGEINDERDDADATDRADYRGELIERALSILDDVEPADDPEGRRMVTAITGGQKETRGARPELVPAGPMWEVARLYGYGAQKYAPRNWERGYDWSLSIGALERHLLKFKMREDFDQDTGCHHLASVVFHALALMEFGNTHPELDDRA